MSSESEPLINKYVSFATNTDINKTKSLQNKTSTKKWIIIIILILLIPIAIYKIFQYKNDINHFDNTNWIQMEQSHTRSHHIPSSWTQKAECNEDHSFTLTLALKQQNTQLLNKHILSVSDPDSITFHKYWTADQVRSYFKPSKEALTSVIEWLSSNEFTIENGKINLLSKYGNVIKVSLTCKDANKLLNTKYLFYENKDGINHLHVENGIYHIPNNIYTHIDFISPTIRFPLRHHSTKIQIISAEDINLIQNNKQSSSMIYNYPQRIYDLYSMTNTISNIIGTVNSLDSSICRQAILSCIEEYYSDIDLQSFWDSFHIYPQSQMGRVPKNQPQGNGAEAELDTQYITSTGKGIYTYDYYISNEQDPFIELAEAILSTDVIPFVVSMSYGADENDLGKEYVIRANEEFGKLALVGITLLASSGDNGVMGDESDCINNEYDDDYIYIPTFPASALYVTSVGGTQDGNIPDNYGMSTQENAWMNSGGGFSEYFDAPKWQKQAIKSYFKQDIEFPDKSRYVSSGRGYPDISAQAVDYVVDIGGDFYTVSGTSASSPVIAGMISMINYQRIESKKSSLGFINPVLYQLYGDKNDENSYFNDVMNGYNIGCSVDNNIGFYTANGWDPVTGVGTPKFNSLYDALLNLD